VRDRVIVQNNPINWIDPHGYQSQINIFYINDPNYYAASKIPAGNFNDVYGHGGITGMWTGPLPKQGPGGHYLTPNQMVDLIKYDPKYDPKLPSRLLGCNVGKGTYCKDVATGLGTRVYCYDNTAWYGTKPSWLFGDQGYVGSWEKSFPNGPDSPVPNYSRPGKLKPSTP